MGESQVSFFNDFKIMMNVKKDEYLAMNSYTTEDF